ncbi:hypothetical protein [Abyssalbus ytuae]|uniref:Uncharacterized protein n=1 Tax=Abyssalbus ytuae TaxID=2926907 RepID=A0A9E7D223_9FLAO|nr:hypothetical protein [Abyssalbus ytuae]UOB17708.1 hypothetical protein MQE35_00070 [Abyssalbus ytuae]
MSRRPKKCITVKEAKTLQANYVSKIEKILKEKLGKEECRDFWWSLEDIEEYITYFKVEAAAKGYKNLGLRFYLGKYDSDNDGYPDQTTMFIAPTGVQTNEDFVSLKGETIGAMTASTDDNIYEIEAMNDGFAGVPPKNY